MLARGAGIKVLSKSRRGGLDRPLLVEVVGLGGTKKAGHSGREGVFNCIRCVDLGGGENIKLCDVRRVPRRGGRLGGMVFGGGDVERESEAIRSEFKIA